MAFLSRFVFKVELATYPRAAGSSVHHTTEPHWPTGKGSLGRICKPTELVGACHSDKLTGFKPACLEHGMFYCYKLANLDNSGWILEKCGL